MYQFALSNGLGNQSAFHLHRLIAFGNCRSVWSAVGIQMHLPCFINRQDRQVIAIDQPLAGIKNGLEHRLCVFNRVRDHLENFGSCSLPFQRFICFPEQPCVLDGDHCLIGEGFQQVDFLRGEAIRFAVDECPPQRYCSNHLAFPKHGCNQPGEITVFLCHAMKNFDRIFPLQTVLHVDGLAGIERGLDKGFLHRHWLKVLRQPAAQLSANFTQMNQPVRFKCDNPHIRAGDQFFTTVEDLGEDRFGVFN